MPPALGALSLNHWTTREVPWTFHFRLWPQISVPLHESHPYAQFRLINVGSLLNRKILKLNYLKEVMTKAKIQK